MPIEECRTIMTAGTSPEAEVTKKAICFGGGPDGTVSQCHVSFQEGSYQQTELCRCQDNAVRLQ